MKPRLVALSLAAVEDFLLSFPEHLWRAHFAPAYAAAFLALAFAAAMLATNHLRPVNQAWALAMILIAGWQGCIGLALLDGRPVFFRLAFAAGPLTLWILLLLQEAILAPWASLRRDFWRIRHGAWTAAWGGVAFVPSFLASGGTPGHPARSPLYWAMEVVAIGSTLLLFARGLLLLRSRQVPAESRADLVGFCWFLGLGPIVQLAVNLVGSVYHLRYIGWLAPSAVAMSLVVLAAIAFGGTWVGARDGRPMARLTTIRVIAYLALAGAVVVFVRLFGEAGASGTIFATAMLALTLALQPVLDRILRGWAERSGSSPTFVGAQMAISVLTESGFDLAELHRGYCAILKQWCHGAREVYLSEGTFGAVWPTEPIPLRILERLTELRAVTPERLEADGPPWTAELAYLVRQRIGAILGAGDAQGGRLVAAFATRPGGGPFNERDLEEAGELLAVMLTGTQLVRLRQRLRGQDRLNFYAQYAPQFAHELRNGLYLQTQLMRAVASGRGREVLPADARAGLESAAQIDRLCEHFFNVGSLYNRPIDRLDLWALLEEEVAKFRHEFDGGPEIVLRLGFEIREHALIMGNPELLSMALHNLVKNGVEACATRTQAPRLELASSRQLDKVHLLVRDNGEGLPDERRLDTFAPGKSHKRAGMGLGLSIARDCVEAMGGVIGVRSSGSSGTCFEITFVGAAHLIGVSAPCDLLLPPE